MMEYKESARDTRVGRCASRRSAALRAESCFTVSGLRPPAAIADYRGTLRPTFTCRTLKPPRMRGHREWLKLEGR
jgi:hypothetical protein